MPLYFFLFLGFIATFAITITLFVKSEEYRDSDENAPDFAKRLIKPKDVTANTLILIGGERFDVSPTDRWVERVKAWLKQGATIKHIIVEPSKLSQERIEELRSLSPKFQSYNILDRTILKQPEDQEYAQYLINSHTTIWINPDNKFMWMESNHPPERSTAYNCEFVSKKRAQDDRRVKLHQERIEALVEIGKNKNESNDVAGIPQIDWQANSAELTKRLDSLNQQTNELRTIAKELAQHCPHRKDHYIPCYPEWNKTTGVWDNCTCGLSEALQRLEEADKPAPNKLEKTLIKKSTETLPQKEVFPEKDGISLLKKHGVILVGTLLSTSVGAICLGFIWFASLMATSNSGNTNNGTLLVAYSLGFFVPFLICLTPFAIIQLIIYNDSK